MSDSENILLGIINVHLANKADMISDPNGRYPACINALGTWTCERCGNDVRNMETACPAIPPEKRWSFRES